MSARLRREASRWLVRLQSEDVSEADGAAFRAWLYADPAHARSFHDVAEALADVAALKHVLAQRQYLYETPPPRLSQFRFARAAAMAAALAVGGLWLAWPRHQSFETATGVLQEIRLGDGSAVTLNSQSAIEASLRGGVRRVRLLRGEAFFVVAHDPTRPFEVETTTHRVRALGTQFSVDVGAEGLDVMVAEGTVLLAPIEREAALMRLRAGQHALVSAANVRVVSLGPDDIERGLAWRSGWLRFEGQSLGEVAFEVSRHTGADISFASPELRERGVVAYFRADHLESFVLGVETAFPDLQVRNEAGKLQVARRDQGQSP